MSDRDNHVRVLPLHVANKIAAGEVVERPASVVKELVENAIDAGAKRIVVSIAEGGRKLVSVKDDGCGMTREDAVLSLERQATSKIRDVDDIEAIDTLGFRGEAIPSIASVSRFSITTRRDESDEGVYVNVEAGTLAEVRSAGCPKGTLVEVRDLFCNVPARRKFLRAKVTEESHIKSVFAVNSLAHADIGFTLLVDGREVYNLAPAGKLEDRVRDLFGDEFLEAMLPIKEADSDAKVKVTGFVERPNLSMPTRREQYVFINGRPATAPSIQYALREAYPRRPGDVRPAVIAFINLPPKMVDVNVHPTKREVRFRDNIAVKAAICEAIANAFSARSTPQASPDLGAFLTPEDDTQQNLSPVENVSLAKGSFAPTFVPQSSSSLRSSLPEPLPLQVDQQILEPHPVQNEIVFASEPSSTHAKPWAWFKFLAQSASGYLLVETDAGIVTVNPIAARERIAYEKLIYSSEHIALQTLLVPETVKLGPVEAARVCGALESIRKAGFQIEEFGSDTFKIDAVPQVLGELSAGAVLSTIAHDLSAAGAKRASLNWREELVAKSVARSFAGAPIALTQEGAVKLIEELCSCRMPYVCPRGKPVMIFTSTRELDRKFGR
jgi:DNA mismatch repair protein MutL